MKYIEKQLFLFWNIGKSVYEKQNQYHNVIEKYANYCSYYFGDSSIFTRENIYLMKLLYMNFPIFYKQMETISWKQYQLLLQIPNKKERFFYFNLSLLFQSDYQGTYDFILNQYYIRI